MIDLSIQQKLGLAVLDHMQSNRLRSHAILKKYCSGAIHFSLLQLFNFLFFEFFNNFY